MKPYWVNPRGYTNLPTNPPQFERSLLFRWRTKQLFEFTADAEKPVTLVTNEGRRIRCDRHFIHNGGSIPPVVEWLTGVTREKYPPSFMYHDSLYQHGGGYVLAGDNWVFCPMTRRECDAVLSQALAASGASPWEIRMVDFGLAIGGGPSWRKHEKRRQEEEKKRSDPMKKVAVAISVLLAAIAVGCANPADHPEDWPPMRPPIIRTP